VTAHAPESTAARVRFIHIGIAPAATLVVVKELVDPRWRVEIEAEAVLEE
jgi:enamine deaminase RidA (YjgF/YER057c/UK114 family)